MKTRTWILVVSLAVVLVSFLAYGQFDLSGANAKSGTPMVGMGDFKKFENQQEYPLNSQHESSLQVRMGDFRVFEASQNVRLGFGDLRNMEFGQIRTSPVGIGDLRRIEQGK